MVSSIDIDHSNTTSYISLDDLLGFDEVWDTTEEKIDKTDNQTFSKINDNDVGKCVAVYYSTPSCDQGLF